MAREGHVPPRIVAAWGQPSDPARRSVQASGALARETRRYLALDSAGGFQWRGSGRLRRQGGTVGGPLHTMGFELFTASGDGQDPAWALRRPLQPVLRCGPGFNRNENERACLGGHWARASHWGRELWRIHCRRLFYLPLMQVASGVARRSAVIGTILKLSLWNMRRCYRYFVEADLSICGVMSRRFCCSSPVDRNRPAPHRSALRQLRGSQSKRLLPGGFGDDADSSGCFSARAQI